MRSVPGQKFKIDWNPNNGFNKNYGDKYYPGDKYVDYIGIDAYDIDGNRYPYPKNCNAACRLDRQTTAWNEVIYGSPRGLKYWSIFAEDHGKQMSFPEWALWRVPEDAAKAGNYQGGEDNPYFIQQMYDFITWKRNNVAYAAYFNYDGPDGEHSLDAAFPESAKLFKKLFLTKKK
jgi:hypothetical protein